MLPKSSEHNVIFTAQNFRAASWADIEPYLIVFIGTLISWAVQQKMLQYEGGHFLQHYPLFPYAPITICFSYFFSMRAVMFSVVLNLIALRIFTPESELTLIGAFYTVIIALFGSVFISEIRRARDSEKELRKTQADLMSMLSRELRGSLTILKKSIESVHTASDTQTDLDRLDKQSKAIDDMSSIINRCLDLDAVLHKGMKINSSTININDLIENIKQQTGDPERIRLHLINKITVRSDPFIMERIITMLIDNALKYSPPDAPIDISCGIVKHQGRMGTAFRCINSIGPSGPPDKAHVFSRYYRANGTEEISGSGLGLWLAKKLVDNLSGFIRLDVSDKQVTFYFWLPFDQKKSYFTTPTR